jgi:uncharacterized membrane protein
LASYAVRVKRDLARWAEQGMITPALAQTLSRDVEANDRRSLSFGSILAMMAALLVGAAILVLIAANWEAIPRLVRVAALFATIAAGYIGGAILKNRDHGAIGEALYIVAAAAFGGSIALIGQMYHMSGDESAAVLTWCIGTGLAAVALRSGPVTIAAAALAATWLFLRGAYFWNDYSIPHYFMVLAALLWLASYWSGSKAARHLILLSVIFHASLLAVHYDVIGIALLLAIVSALLFAAAVFLPEPVERVVRLDGGFPAHCLIGFLVGMGMLQLELMDDEGWRLAAVAAATFAGIATAVVLAGRESRGLRWIAYLAFSLELAFVYTVTVGTMLDTAGLFLASGVVLGLVALIIIRIEKRMRAEPAVEGAAS